MRKLGFDSVKYNALQSQSIKDRISRFGGKLYLEFGGKLFDDYHASRVFPGFQPDSKVRMLLEMKDVAEIVLAISADDIERSKRRGDLGITYDEDTLRLIVRKIRTAGYLRLLRLILIEGKIANSDKSERCIKHAVNRLGELVFEVQELAI